MLRHDQQEEEASTAAAHWEDGPPEIVELAIAGIQEEGERIREEINKR